MSNLQLSNVELVSVLRTAPANGTPSSQDYYDSQSEAVADLAALVNFINVVLQPILSGLKSTASDGLESTSLYTDTSSKDAIAYNSTSEVYLTVADSLRILYGISQTLNTSLTNISQQVASLQAKLSATNQNDIALALQNITAQLVETAEKIASLTLAVSNMQEVSGSAESARISTLTIAPTSTESVRIIWSVPFSSNNYAVICGVEDSSGFLQTTGFTYLSNGTGVLVYVKNTDTKASHSGYVHVTASSTITTY